MLCEQVRGGPVWKQADGLKVYCSSPCKKWGDCGCRRCGLLRVSSSPLSGTLGFHPSMPLKVRQELFKTYFAQWNWEVTCATSGRKFKKKCAIYRVPRLPPWCSQKRIATWGFRPRQPPRGWQRSRCRPHWTQCEQGVPLLGTEPSRFGGGLLPRRKVSGLVLCLHISIIFNFQINFPVLQTCRYCKELLFWILWVELQLIFVALVLYRILIQRDILIILTSDIYISTAWLFRDSLFRTFVIILVISFYSLWFVCHSKQRWSWTAKCMGSLNCYIL